jgi:hypothetical protein
MGVVSALRGDPVMSTANPEILNVAMWSIASSLIAGMFFIGCLS